MAMTIQSGDTLSLNLATSAVTGTVAGVNQVETATIVAAAGATTAGNLNVTVTSALVTGSPLVVPVALLLTDDTAAKVATKVRSALTATAAITAHYTVGGSSASYSLTAIVKAPNDTTLNLAHANGTSVGITTAATSTNTTAGVGTSMAYRLSGTAWDAKDHEGIAIPTATKLYSMLIRSADTAGVITIYDGDSVEIANQVPFYSLTTAPDGDHHFTGDTLLITATTAAITLYIDIHAGT